MALMPGSSLSWMVQLASGSTLTGSPATGQLIDSVESDQLVPINVG